MTAKRLPTVIKDILVAIGILLVVKCVVHIVIIVSFMESSKWYYEIDFDEYGDSFRVVRDFIVSEDLAENNSYLGVDTDWKGGNRLYAPGIGGYLELPDDVYEALRRIDYEAFPPKAEFNAIRLEEGRISFCLINGAYSLVWSPNGKPTGIDSSDDDRKFCMKKIGDGWYHMADDPYR